MLFRYVFLHELAHLILHGILPKHIRTEYMRAESEIEFNRNLEEAYCELCAILALKNGALEILNQNVETPIEEDFEVALTSMLPRSAPYKYFKELGRIWQTGGKERVDSIMLSFIERITKSQNRLIGFKQLFPNLAVKRCWFGTSKGIVKKTGDLLDDIEPCTDYGLYIVI